ncbi:MAG: hypothetical protein KF819_04005 [Labilithrix sp.]|nr:hypothetical protein [Labilithrix sp.]
MSRHLRSLLSVLLALVLAIGSTTARAQELGPMPAAHGQQAQGPSAPALTAPHDVPVLGPSGATDLEVPPVPSGYVTREISGWMKLSFPTAATERVESIVNGADAMRIDLRAALGQPVLDRVEVRIAPTSSEMARLAPTLAPPPQYASGVAYPRAKLILLTMLAPRGADATDLDEVLKHELAHVALDEAVRGHHVPVWFNEGLAIGLSGERAVDRHQTLWNATIRGTLIPFADLDRSFPADPSEVSIAYAESADFLRFLMRRGDMLRFRAMIERVRDGQAFDRALADAYAADLRKLEFQWRSDVERRYSVIPILAGGGVIWVAVIAALGWGYVRRRRRAKAILAKWAEEEAIEDALLAQEAARRAEEASPTELVGLSVRALRSPAKVEHDGRWHTLH